MSDDWERDAEIRRLQRVIAKELSENDELGSEYTYVNSLRCELKELRAELLASQAREMVLKKAIHDYFDPAPDLKELIGKLVGALEFVAYKQGQAWIDSNGGPDKRCLSDDRNERIIMASKALADTQAVREKMGLG